MKKVIYLALATSAITTLHNISIAQVVNPKKVIQRKGENRLNNKIDNTIDKGFDKLEEGINSIFKGNNNNNNNNNSTNNNTTSNGTAPSQSSNTNSANNNYSTTNPTNDQTDFSEYKQSTYIPGSETIYFEDFKLSSNNQSPIGWTVKNIDKSKPGFVTKINGSDDHWLRVPKQGVFFPSKIISLPNEVTIEFDMYVDQQLSNHMYSGLYVAFIARNDMEKYDYMFNKHNEVSLDIHPSGVEGLVRFVGRRQTGLPEGQREFYLVDIKNIWKTNQINHVAIQRKNRDVKIFINGVEYIDYPNAFLVDDQYKFMMHTFQLGDGIYFTNLRIATKQPNSSQAFKSNNKFVTEAIYFDVNAARIKPTSWTTLKDIAQAIKSTNGSIEIIGHTDSDGTDESNLILSQKRAEAVKYALIKEFGIQADKISTKGMGESQPVEQDNTAYSKAKNRRVEFILSQ